MPYEDRTMTRSFARRGHAVQVEKSSPPDTARHPDPPPSPTASAVPWYWQIALFLWITSYAGLFIYEWLAGIIKAWQRG
jgi:hypothetical protein